jgi:hypothetical protein
MHDFSEHKNADTCELGFRHLSTTASEGCGGWFCEGLHKMWSNNTHFSVPCSQYRWWGEEVSSSGHGGEEGMLQVRLVFSKY